MAGAGVGAWAWMSEAGALGWWAGVEGWGVVVKAGGEVERAVWDGAYGGDGDEMGAGWGEREWVGDGWVVVVQGEGEGPGFGDEEALVGTAGVGEVIVCGEKEEGF